MKKMFAVALMMIGLSSFAQEKITEVKKGERAKMEKLTPEQRNELQLKKLTLALDLNTSQQKEFKTIIAERNAKREAAMEKRKASEETKKELTADERFAKQNKMLDEKIAMKARVKKILTPEQFEKWEKMNASRHHQEKKFHKMKSNGEKGKINKK